MAGMLPGVECARRRRFHQGGATEVQSGTRRSSFCLYRSGHESHLISSSSVQRSVFNKSTQSEGLGDAAREARERLDGRLRAQPASEIRRHNSTGSLRPGGGTGTGNNNNNNQGGVVSSGALAKLQREVFCSKTKGSGRPRFSWSSWLGWKAAEQDHDCAVCLEEFRGGDVLVHLPCAHRFHCRCVLPWLESSSHCPCCRMEITV